MGNKKEFSEERIVHTCGALEEQFHAINGEFEPSSYHRALSDFFQHRMKEDLQKYWSKEAIAELATVLMFGKKSTTNPLVRPIEVLSEEEIVAKLLDLFGEKDVEVVEAFESWMKSYWVKKRTIVVSRTVEFTYTTQVDEKTDFKDNKQVEEILESVSGHFDRRYTDSSDSFTVNIDLIDAVTGETIRSI